MVAAATGIDIGIFWEKLEGYNWEIFLRLGKSTEKHGGALPTAEGFVFSEKPTCCDSRPEYQTCEL